MIETVMGIVCFAILIAFIGYCIFDNATH